MNKKYLPDEFDLEEIQGLKGCHRIIGFCNRFSDEWIGDIRKIGNGINKGKFKWTTLIRIGEKETLKDFGYNDKWSKENKYLETNLEFLITKKQMIELRNLFDKKLKKQIENIK